MDEGEAGPAPSVDAAGLFELLDNSRGNQGRDNVGSHGEMEDQGHRAGRWNHQWILQSDQFYLGVQWPPASVRRSERNFVLQLQSLQ